MRRGNTFGRVCLCVCPVRALTFESLDLQTSFLVCKYIFKILRSSSYVKVIGSRSRSQEQKTGFTSVYLVTLANPVFCSCDLDLELFRLNARVHGTFFMYYCVTILCPVYVHYCLKPKNLKTFFAKIYFL